MHRLFKIHAIAALLSLAQAGAHGQTVDTPSPARQVVTRADQLPSRSYTLAKLPSEYLAAPLDDLKALGAKLEADLSADLARYDIQDPAALRAMYGGFIGLVQLRSDWRAVPEWTAKVRALQDKPGPKLTSGMLTDLLARQALEKRDGAWLGREIAARYGALPWAEVQDIVKSTKGGIETYNPELVAGAFRTQLDTVAKNGNMTVPDNVLLTIINSRVQLELLYPNKAVVVSGLQTVIDANKTANAADIWTPRTFALPAETRARPVVIAVWDSGVDLSLFKAAAARGVAFDIDNRPAEPLLRPLGSAQPRWPRMRALVKGSMDQGASQDTPESQQYRATLAALKADEVKAFMEDMSLAGLYVHGTHVAGIAVEGNPFAEVYTATMLWNHMSEPDKPSETRSRDTVAAYRAIVQGFKKAGVRVVNMSWRYGPGAYESMMGYYNIGGSPEERKREAARLFKIERDALHDAIAGAPDILFVAASGNEDRSADFHEYIPSGLELPNLITAGAVDKSGRETSFSTFGKTIVVHANGFEVDSVVPGGEHMKLSGTSMASPQVANLAAKLIAARPELTPKQVKTLILDGADRMPGTDGKPGRVNLLNPRASAALAGIRLGTGS
jgi:subtilisin family serine protease